VPRQVALLRGINLGRNRRVSMGDLRELLEGHGYEDVRTHLQSGNVVLSSPITGARLERALVRQLADGLGIEVEVLVRSRKQLADVVARDPLGKVAKNPSRYLVTFLRSKPPAKVVRELEAEDVAPEQLVVDGREVYSWHPGGFQRSKLRRLLAQRPGVTATGRNWSTVTRLLALADEEPR
jgi:uncharacterized protein (DUF1697 family)